MERWGDSYGDTKMSEWLELMDFEVDVFRGEKKKLEDIDCSVLRIFVGMVWAQFTRSVSL